MNPTSTKLHVVVACTDRKRRIAGAPIRLGDVNGRTLKERCRAWWRFLSRAPASVPAHDLYAGDHWSIARSLPDIARSRGFAPSLWVASAGYGLVAEKALLASYSATFALDSPDSVVTDGSKRAEIASNWWQELARHTLSDEEAPRTLRALAKDSPRGATLLVVASPAYLEALERDLVDVVSLGHGHIRLVLVTSAPGPADPSLHPHWVPTAAALRMKLGGALTSLHVRVARRLIQKISPLDFDANHARAHIERLLARSPKVPTHHRHRADDEDVLGYIRKALRANPSASHTGLLREYRASGRACEQSRFRELFKREIGTL